jgi:hypothetical protein
MQSVAGSFCSQWILSITQTRIETAVEAAMVAPATFQRHSLSLSMASSICVILPGGPLEKIFARDVPDKDVGQARIETAQHVFASCDRLL